ncbi:hypothetical protein DFJ58DRAFT_726394 [Suillus subalutaceus]|uniref:uncharacterized protein n=1 Tax=Suillus subalutaceus TaxID=48586 RepID=UPI001B875472|nr:uncharacterized protein DFJ58DRAFT_726394 [Suillus subalutaceus]KAG1859371.1 hypothetical protein DFJ58DRAFT_726394 [Suillus subalutaceus]
MGKNGHPRLPDPALLELLCAGEVDAPNSKAKPKARWNRKLKLKLMLDARSNDEGPKASQLGWYSSRWRSFLEDAKGECHTQQALENPFPSLVVDMPVSITESLSASLVQWLKNGHQVDAGVWPEHKPDMARLVCIYIVEHAAWVEAAAEELLDNGKFLHHGLNDLGKTRNFAHPALHEAIILFMYTGTYRIAHRRPGIFRKEVPLKCLALFHCVLQGLVKHGNGKFYPKFTTKEYESVYMAMLSLLENVKNDPYHGPKLMHQLREWAQAGWTEACKYDGINTSKHHNLRVQLD